MALDLQLSLLARKIGVWVAESCSDGRCNHVNLAELKATFAGISERGLEEAIAELDTDGFVQVSRTLGGGLPHFRPTLDLYLTFDGPAFDRDPVTDTICVAELALAGPDSVNAENVFAQTGWDIRRFNPAFEHVAAQVPDGRVSRAFGTQFTVSFFHCLAEDRVQIRRLISRLKT